MCTQPAHNFCWLGLALQSWARIEGSLRLTLERFGNVIRQSRPGRIHYNRQKIVVSDYAEKIDDALLAELGDGTAVGRVADALGAQNFRGRIVCCFFVLGHAHGTTAIGDGIGYLAPQTLLQCDRIVRVPFVLLRPLARRDQDHHLVKAGTKRTLETQIVAHSFGAQHDLWAANQRNEWSPNRIATPLREFLGGFPLSVGELVHRDRRHSILRGERSGEETDEERGREACAHGAALQWEFVWSSVIKHRSDAKYTNDCARRAFAAACRCRYT